MTVDSALLPAGFAEFLAQLTITRSNGQKITENVNIRSYNGFYSGMYITSAFNTALPNDGNKDPFHAYMQPTTQLPTAGKATYTGRAFNDSAANDTNFRYSIDFGTQRGSGEIAASKGAGKITLGEGKITRETDDGFTFYAIDGAADTEKAASSMNTYTIGLAGPNAEEIIGSAEYTSKDGARGFLGLQGSRGKIAR